MAYCRWSDSDVYIFWKCSSEDVISNQQLCFMFEINMTFIFEYCELKKIKTREDYRNIFEKNGMTKDYKISEDCWKDIIKWSTRWKEEVEEEYPRRKWINERI